MKGQRGRCNEEAQNSLLLGSYFDSDSHYLPPLAKPSHRGGNLVFTQTTARIDELASNKEQKMLIFLVLLEIGVFLLLISMIFNYVGSVQAKKANIEIRSRIDALKNDIREEQQAPKWNFKCSDILEAKLKESLK